MAESVQDYAIFMLDPGGHIMSWNPGAARAKQYAAHEIIGKHFSIFYTQADIERKWPQLELQRATMDGRFEDEGWRVRKDGSRFWAHVVITALRDESGKLLAFSKITRDLIGAQAAGGGAAAQRGALPSAGRGRAGLRHLHADPGRDGDELERRRAPHQGLRGARDRRQAFLALLPSRRHRRRQAVGRAGHGARARPRRGRGLAGAQGRHALLGARGRHRAARRGRPAARLRQGHAGPDAAAAVRGARGCRAAGAGLHRGAGARAAQSAGADPQCRAPARGRDSRRARNSRSRAARSTGKAPS